MQNVRRAARIMNPSEEREASVYALQRDLEAAMMVFDAVSVRRLSWLLLETRVDALWQARVGEPAAGVESLRIKLNRMHRRNL